MVRDKGWEALIISFEGKHVDFLRFDPRGEFYLWRALQDDVSDRIPPEKMLEPILVILRVAEALLVGLAFAKALEWKSEEARLGFTLSLHFSRHPQQQGLDWLFAYPTFGRRFLGACDTRWAQV